MPGEWPAEVTVLVTFEEVAGGKTKVTVREVGVPGEMSHFARLGWEQQLGKLAESLR